MTTITARAARKTTSTWFTVKAGACIRGHVRHEIEGGAWDAGLDIRTDESRILSESVYRFTVTGEARRVKAFVGSVREWMLEVSQ